MPIPNFVASVEPEALLPCPGCPSLVHIIISRVGLSPLGTAATTGLLYQPQMIDDGDCG
jgi:hypothetical protein